jgi:hypothetical protein
MKQIKMKNFSTKIILALLSGLVAEWFNLVYVLEAQLIQTETKMVKSNDFNDLSLSNSDTFLLFGYSFKTRGNLDCVSACVAQTLCALSLIKSNLCYLANSNGISSLVWTAQPEDPSQSVYIRYTIL